MPGIHLFGRRFNFSSDDLTIPSLIDILFRFPLLIIFLIFHQKYQLTYSKCLSSIYFIYFSPLLLVYILITIIALIIFYLSLQGTPVNNIYPRRHMSLLIYIRLILLLIDIIINIIGLIFIIRIYRICDDLLRGMIVLSIVISCITALTLFVILAFLIDLTGVISSEKKWKMRIKFLFCYGQSSDLQNIVQILQYLFDDERYDLVPSDLAAGLVLLQQEDLLEKHSINIKENVPLELLKEGFYYNSYAQSAFGWFSLAYQYRMTFIPRILFAIHFRTIGFCCCCCRLPCCQHPDSLYDPCGSQFSTLQYLLRKQKPMILYANFLGAFGRAPFYIAADDEKKTIIVSIRGTLSATDILTDINVVEDVLESELFGIGYCHSGMHSAANYIHDDISLRLISIFMKYPTYSLVICGYSLGAGIAAILSIKFKSIYPHLKCYGIAMPGSVLSENLALSTRDFIYSFIVDVDMIARTSIHSLEYLRNRLFHVLNQTNHRKFSILTKTFLRTLTKRQQIFHSTIDHNSPIDHRSTSERQPLVLPGTIIHLYSIDRINLFTRQVSYRACISTYQQFNQLIVHPRMWFDHFPASYNTAFRDVIEHFQDIH